MTSHYDDYGRDVGYSLDNIRKATYSYNVANGRLSGMNIGAKLDFSFGYLANTDLQSSITYPNGMVKMVNYEQQRNLISSVEHKNGATQISKYAYTNDILARRTVMVQTYDGISQTTDYGYNDRSEVTSANRGPGYAYAYDFDNIGNRKTSTENATQKTYESNVLNQYEGNDFAFDLDGNQTQVKTATGTWNVEYNGENRPIRFTQGTTEITMAYDYLGRRFSKTTNGATQKFLYRSFLQIEEQNEENASTKSYIWDPAGTIFTSPLVMSIGNDLQYYVHDANKNITELIASNGNITGHYEYSPFGTITSATGTLATSNPFRFSSEYFDTDLGLVYYNYRHYNPTDGKWISRDPIEERGGWHLFSYVQNNINSIDILGLASDLKEKNEKKCEEIVERTKILLKNPNSVFYKYTLRRMKEKGVSLSDCPLPTAKCECCKDGSKGFYNDKAGDHGTIIICNNRNEEFTKMISTTIAHELDHHIQRCARKGGDPSCDQMLDDEIESYRNAPTILGEEKLTIDEMLDETKKKDKDKEYLRRIIESVFAMWRASKNGASIPSDCMIPTWGKHVLDPQCLEDKIRERARAKLEEIKRKEKGPYEF